MKEKIIASLKEMEKENLEKIGGLKRRASIIQYEHLTRSAVVEGADAKIWSDALQAALNENEIVTIPANKSKYYIDKTVVIPSDRRIEADGDAHIRLTPETDVIMLRNEHTADGTHLPILSGTEDCNISISGGVWEECHNERFGYGKTGKYDAERSFYGVSTCMLFNNMQGLTLTDMVFSHTAGFAVQMGDIKNVVCKNIHFDSCYADGIHINGNTHRVITSHISGQVGDDLVALNMYDWQDSSVNFGPLKTALVENLDAYADGDYKAFRILPGTYFYDDGSSVDCSVNDVIIRNVKGVKGFKMYFQTPLYTIGTQPEKGDVGSGDNIFFEDIDIDLNTPVDSFSHYINSDPQRGAFGAFEVGANIGNLHLSNINLTLHRDKFPLSYLMCVGPKSAWWSDGVEIFDPYISCTLSRLVLENITVNGEKLDYLSPFIHITEFNNINNDGNSTGKGVIEQIETL